MFGDRKENYAEQAKLLENIKTSVTLTSFPYAELGLMSGTMPKCLKSVDHVDVAREFMEVFSFIYGYHSSRLTKHTRKIE